MNKTTDEKTLSQVTTAAKNRHHIIYRTAYRPGIMA